MEKKEIIERLNIIKTLSKMNNDEIKNICPYLEDKDLNSEFRYAYIMGVISSKIEFLIEDIQG